MEYTKELVEKFSPLVDEDVLQFWAANGYGLPDDGYFRLVDTEAVLPLMEGLYEDHERAVPIISTGFGDLIIFKDDSYIVLRFRDRATRVVGVKLPYLLHDLNSDFFRKEMFNPFLFAETAAQVGIPTPDKQFTIEHHGVQDGQNSATIKRTNLLETLQAFADAGEPLGKPE